MNTKNVLKWSATSILLACAGSVVATPGVIDVDGTRADDPYPANSLVNQASKAIDELLAGPFSASADSDQTVPMGGEGVGDYSGSQLNGPTEDVMTGWEGRLNLQFLGWNGTDPVNVAGFINGGDFLSNQVIGTIDPVNSGNLGAAGIDFSAMMGNQFVTVSGTATADPTIDGSIDMAEAANYALLYAQETFTQFGDNNNPDPVANSGGSELDNVYAYISDPNGSLPTVDGDEWLNVFVGGNLENNGNNLTLWLDVDAAAGISTGFGGGGVSNLGDLAGNTLDISAEWGIQYNRNSGGTNHYFALVQQDGMTPFSAGNGNAAFPGVTSIEDGMMNTVAEVTFDDSNVLGVAGSEFGGSFGGSDEPTETDPATDDTGVEMRINLTQLGYDPMDGWDGMGGGVRVSGFVIEANAVSNQILGGLPADAGPLDAVAGVNFDSIPGDQFVVVSDSTMTPPVIDGVRDSSYGAPEYVNNVDGTGNATNRTSPQGANSADDDPMGSEINNFSGVLTNEGGQDILYVHTGGALGNFDRLYLYVDHTSTDGENQLSGFNPNIDDGRANNAAGLTFDAGFTADLLMVYRLGTDATSMDVTHFFEGLQITTGMDDMEIAGSFGGGLKTAGAITGTLESRAGFGNNTDNTPTNANGDELAGLRAYLSQRDLGFGAEPYVSLMFTGNLKPVFNKLNIFIDADPAVGQSTLIWDGDLMTGEPTPSDDGMGGANPDYVGNPPVDFDALQNYGGPFPDLGTMDPMDTLPGMTFDAGFAPDHFITLTAGNVTAGTDGILGTADDDGEIFANFARLRTAGMDGIFDSDNLGDDDPGDSEFLGQTTFNAVNPILSGGDPGGMGPQWQIAINNTNVSGVPGGATSFGITSTQNLFINAVSTGIEISFPAAAIQVGGMPWDGTGQIGLLAMIGNGSHTFMSSQFLPPVCANELGDPRTIDFAADHQDQQYIRIETPAMATDAAYTVVAGQDFLTFDECVEPVGACCMGESCSVLTQSACETMGGTFQGGGTDCGVDPIDNPCLFTGACCIPMTGCLELNTVECTLAGGTFQGDGTTCDPDPCTPTNDCIADFDNDGDVDLGDFGVFGGAFGSMTGDANYNPDADFDNDGDVDLGDFGVFGGEFGRTNCFM
ncbi:MAG: hypothetical protein Tsb0013_07180 [Phycisphaerales bacterium]